MQHKNAHKKDLTGNLKAGEILAQSGNTVLINEHKLQQDKSNPEFTINDTLSDLKTPDKLGGIKTAFRKAQELQKITTAVIRIAIKADKAEIAEKLKEGFKLNTKIKQVWVINTDDSVKLITRDM